MSPVASSFSETEYQAQVQRHYRRNFTVNILDFACYFWGMSFASIVTILPLYLSHLTTSPLLIGLVPALGSVLWFLPQLFTANYVERLERKLPFILLISINERWPYLALGLSILLWPHVGPTLSIVLFFLLLSIVRLSGGLGGAAWQDYIAKIIPLGRRGLFFGLSNSLGGVLGAGGAAFSAYLLNRLPFPTSFAYCFLMAFVANVLSWSFLAMGKEPPRLSTKPPISQGEYFRRLPDILRRDRNFFAYLLSRIVIVLGGMASGFFTIYAVQRFQIPDQTAGWFTTVLLGSQALSNPLLGHLGDRRGHKLVMEIAACLGVVTLILLLTASHIGWFFPVFALYGCSSSGFMLAGMSIILEFSRPEDRPTYIGLANTCAAPFWALAPLAGGWIVSTLGYRALFTVALGFSLTGWLLLHCLVQEPRRSKPLTEGAYGTGVG